MITLYKTNCISLLYCDLMAYWLLKYLFLIDMALWLFKAIKDIKKTKNGPIKIKVWPKV